MKLITIVLFLLFTFGCKKERSPIIYNIPESFSGSLIVVYEEEGFPKLNKKDDAFEFNFPSSGVLITSSSQEYGWAKDRYFYIYTNGKKEEVDSYFSSEGTSIHEGATVSSIQKGKTYHYFQVFIGTKKQYDQVGDLDDSFERIEREIAKKKVSLNKKNP